MVPKSKKIITIESKSKRLSCAQKYKIQRKIREHGRKVRKEARKNPVSKKPKKDPGIPKNLPFKDAFIQEMQDNKMQSDEMDRRRKQSEQSIAQLSKAANARALEFEQQNEKSPHDMTSESAVDGTRDNSKKAYYKEFKKVVEQADVVLEVLDARDPLGCRTKKIEEMVLSSGVNKRLILVLNKIDLVPREVVEKWLKYLRNEFPTIAFKSSTQNQKNNLSQKKVSMKSLNDSILNSSECLGADNLMKILKNYCRNANIKTSIRVGVIGYPNVGKSSVINSLKRSKVCNVGSTPGLTKSMQEIHLDKHIKLIDCPGIVFGKATSEKEQAQVILRNCVKVELIEDPIAPVELIVNRCSKKQLMDLYNIPAFVNVQDFLVHIARQKGRIKKGGIPDLDSAAKAILQDWNNNRIPFYTIPPASGPAVENHLTSSIVTEWAKEFEIGSLVSTELDETKTKSEFSSRMLAVEAHEPADVDMSAASDDEMSDASQDLDHHIILETLPKKKQSQVEQTEALDEHEKLLNPQLNKDRKKLAKLKKKETKRLERMAASEMDEDMDDVAPTRHSYDFNQLLSLSELPDEDL